VIELIACDVEVSVRAWVMSCFSFACKNKNKSEGNVLWSLGLTSHARAMSDGTARDGAVRLF